MNDKRVENITKIFTKSLKICFNLESREERSVSPGLGWRGELTSLPVEGGVFPQS